MYVCARHKLVRNVRHERIYSLCLFIRQRKNIEKKVAISSHVCNICISWYLKNDICTNTCLRSNLQWY